MRCCLAKKNPKENTQRICTVRMCSVKLRRCTIIEETPNGLSDQAAPGKIKLEFNAVHSNHLRVTKKDQGLVGKCKAASTLSVQKVGGF